MGYDQNTVAAVVSELRAAGMSDNGIRALFANIRDESGFNPGLRHPDQPAWGGEAHYAHGLSQEGGQEWNNYEAWLNKNAPGSDWRDPTLQTRFLAQNLKANYAPVWDTLNNGTAEQGAQAFVRGYLKPAQANADRRAEAYSHGVPELASYGNLQPQPLSLDAYGNMGAAAGGAAAGAALSDPATAAAVSAAQTPSVAPITPQAPASSGGLFGALGIDRSNIGGTGVGISEQGLSIPGLGTIGFGGSQGGQLVSNDIAPQPLSMAPAVRKPIDMRGVYALAQQPRLGI